ncbi:hypothetical protein CDL15_Pgr014219 [Punica granatum]|uniref:NAD-dependent epimerase/dehydratase domain-containing protein n=1 Tax=Punica granatum TaxID=22663 RepID=A0A218WD05_PUNGR|nr:hypothetical protein CDL15_Pgr014219 [Punica granatum]
MELLGSFRVAVKLQLVKGLPGASTYKIRACYEAKVRRVIYISSVSAVGMNSKWPNGRAKDENCWSDNEYCNATATEAESMAFEYGKQNRLDVVAVNPGYVFGPVMQPILNFSTMLLLNFVESQHNYSTISEKLQKLGWTYRSLEEALMDSIESYKEAVLLD